MTALEANYDYRLEDVLSELEWPKKIENDNTPHEERLPIYDRKTSPRLIELKAMRMALWQHMDKPTFVHEFMSLTEQIEVERDIVKSKLNKVR